MPDEVTLTEGQEGPIATTAASPNKIKHTRLLIAAVAIVLVLGLFRIIAIHSMRPAFLGCWQRNSSMPLPDGTYENASKKYTFNADGSGTEEQADGRGQADVYSEQTSTPFTWVAGQDPNPGMNNAPVVSVHFNTSPADAAPFTYHWSVSDDHETLKMDSDEFTKVVQ